MEASLHRERGAELENLNFTQQSKPDPEVHARSVAVPGRTEPELERVERGACAEEQEILHERPNLCQFNLQEAQARRRLPEVPPPPGQHACPHSLPRVQEAEDVLEEAVWQRFYGWAVGRSRRRLSLAPFRRTHSVEQVAGVVAVSCAAQETIATRNDAKHAGDGKMTGEYPVNTSPDAAARTPRQRTRGLQIARSGAVERSGGQKEGDE